MFKEYTEYDGLGLAALIKNGEVSAKDVLEAAIHRANALNPKLNAIIHRFDERAYREVEQGLPQGAFTGVPFLLKDLSFYFKGEPITMGSRAISMVNSFDSEMVKRFKAAGLNTFGKTNTPEFGLIITTEPKAHGVAHNPYKRGYSTGGSSGGSAAAVATGIVPIAGAGDGGGSIRFPSAWCGVFGLKPSRGRNPLGPVYGEGWDGAIADHVITRSVRDSAAMLDATHGAELGAPYHIAPPQGTFLEAVLKSPKQLKIGLSKRPLIAGTKLDKDVLTTLKQTAKQLERMGHRVEEVEPSIEIEHFWRDFFVVVCAHTAYMVEDLSVRLGKEVAKGIEPQTKNMAMIGRSLSARDLVAAKEGWHKVSLSMGHYLSKYDAMLCPTVPTPAVKHGVLPASTFDEWMMRSVSGVNIGKLLMDTGLAKAKSHAALSKMAFTILGNVTGLPAMSMPLGMSKKGLPIGMQMLGRMGDEATLFSIAGEFERAGLFTQAVF